MNNRLGLLIAFVLIFQLQTITDSTCAIASAGDITTDKKQIYSAAYTGKVNIPLTSDEQKWLDAHPMIRVGSEPDYAPFVFRKGETPSGYSIDLIKLLAERLGINLQFVPEDFSKQLAMIKSLELDVITTLNNIPERADFIKFSKSYKTPVTGIFTRSDQTDISSLISLNGKTVSFVKGDALSTAFKKKYPQIKQVLTGNYLGALRMVSVGEADATILQISVATHHIQESALSNIKIVGGVDTDEFRNIGYQVQAYHFGIRHDWPELTSLLDKALDNLTQEEWHTLDKKWLNISEKKIGIGLTRNEKIWLKEHPVIRVATDPLWQPVEFRDEKGEYHGISIDYLKKIESMLGVQFEFVRESWQELIALAKKGQLDIFTCVAETPGRRKYLLFTDSYIQMPVGIFANEGAAYISDLGMISSKKIAVVKNYATHDYFAEHYPDIDLALVNNPEEGIQNVIEKKAFAFIGNTITTGYLLSHKGFLHINLVGEIPFAYNQKIGVRKEWPILRNILQKALDTIPESEKNAIYNKWMPITYEKPRDYTLIWQLGFGTLAIICLVIFWNRKLSIEVNNRTAEFRESEARFKKLVDSSFDGIFIHRDFITLELNKQMADMLDRNRESLLGNNFKDWLSFDSRKRIKKYIQTDQKGVYQVEMIRADGDLVNAEIFGIDCMYQGGEARIVAVRNITEQIKIARQLQQAQKMEAIGTLAGGIAHDFNNILFPIIGFAELLQDDIPKDSPLQESVMQIYKSSLRAKDLVRQILTFSRQDNPELKPVKLQILIKEIIKLLGASIPSTIDIQADIDPDCGMVVADPTQIHQIIMNLATNAFHAMQESGGQLKLCLAHTLVESKYLGFDELKPGEYALIKIIDTGKGIKKDIKDKIFDPYFTTKPKGKGTGLGLSVVKGIAKNYHGDIHVYSEYGRGTEVHVYLPTIQKLSKNKEIHTLPPIKGGTEKILLVDDEKAIAGLQKKMLERFDYSVTAHTSSVDALNIFKANPDLFDLIVTDMTMPVMTGTQLILEIKKIRPNIPIIVCTGFSDDISDEKCRSLDIECIVTKPIIQSDMLKAIRQAFKDSKEG